MRIVSFAEFMSLPAGTLYTRHSKGNFGEFEVKTENITDVDWQYRSISPADFDDPLFRDDYFDIISDMQQGNDFLMDFNTLRNNSNYDDFWGMKAPQYEYAIFTKEDTHALAATFQAMYGEEAPWPKGAILKVVYRIRSSDDLSNRWLVEYFQSKEQFEAWKEDQRTKYAHPSEEFMECNVYKRIMTVHLEESIQF